METSLQTKINEDLKTAMKERKAVKLSILRVLKGELARAEQEGGVKVELDNDAVQKVVKKMVKNIKETTNNEEEIAALEEYLPKQLSESEIRGAIQNLKYSGATNVGQVMTRFKEDFPGLYDGKQVSTIAKEILS